MLRKLLSRILATGLAGLASAASAQDMRPPVGGVASPADAMIFYIAYGAAGACGQDCSEWVAAEGTVQWDTHKRLFALLDRTLQKLPVMIHSWGDSNLNVAASLGRIIRGRSLDTSAAPTLPKSCAQMSEADCFALKRQGGVPLEAIADGRDVRCDLACVLILAGGVRRALPDGARVVLTGMQIRNRLGLNVADERRAGLTVTFGEQLRRYLKEMGVDPALLDIADRNAEAGKRTELTPLDWVKFGLVTPPR
ncbi:MAG: hypothetical protein ACXWJW_02905 [Xanthobacteraceae bacterium]